MSMSWENDVIGDGDELKRRLAKDFERDISNTGALVFLNSTDEEIFVAYLLGIFRDFERSKPCSSVELNTARLFLFANAITVGKAWALPQIARARARETARSTQ